MQSTILKYWEKHREFTSSSPFRHTRIITDTAPSTLFQVQTTSSHNTHIRHTSKARRYLPIRRSIPHKLNRSSIDGHHNFKPLSLWLVITLLSPNRKPNHPFSIAEDLSIPRRSEDPHPESSPGLEQRIVEFHILTITPANFR